MGIDYTAPPKHGPLQTRDFVGKYSNTFGSLALTADMIFFVYGHISYCLCQRCKTDRICYFSKGLERLSSDYRVLLGASAAEEILNASDTIR